MSSYLVQRPDEKLQYALDWSSWLGDGETILSRQWSISPSGPTLTGDTTDTVTVDNMTFGVLYRLSEVIQTSTGQAGERALSIRCAK